MEFSRSIAVRSDLKVSFDRFERERRTYQMFSLLLIACRYGIISGLSARLSKDNHSAEKEEVSNVNMTTIPIGSILSAVIGRET